MKNLIKRFSVIFIFLLLNSSFILSQTIDNGEFMFVNKSSNQISVKIYPNGAIFNGNNEYNLYAFHRISTQEEHKYIYPLGPNPMTLDPYGTGTYLKRVNFDRDLNTDYCDFSIGFGKYRIEIDDYTNPVFSFDIDFSDADFCGSNPDYYRRIRIDFYSISNITYNFIANDGTTNFDPIAISSESVINVWELQGTPHQGWFTQNKGDFTEATDVPEFLTWPLIATGDYQAMGHLNSEEIGLNVRIATHNMTMNILDVEKPVIFQDCKLTIDESNILTINEGQNQFPQLKLIGSNAKFESKNGSQLIMPKDFILWITDRATLESNGTNFFSENPNEYWSQFVITNPGTIVIRHCIFDNSFVPLIIENSLANNIEISNNTFRNIAFRAINIMKGYNVLISENQFWLGENNPYYGDGILIYEPSSSEEENNIGFGYNVNIIGNEFHGGRIQLFNNGSASELLPVYICDNNFYDGQVNMYFIYCNGTVSNNFINSTLTYTNAESECAGFYWSSPDFFRNTFSSNYNNFELYDLNCPNLAPVTSGDGNLIWTGGYNSLTSINNKNIKAWGPGAPNFFITDFGSNGFDLENQNEYHFWGYMNTRETDYYSTSNCWFLNGSSVNPYYFLLNNDGIPMTIRQSLPTACPETDFQIIDRIITNRGNGIYDTILISQANNIPTPTEDVILYGSGVKNQKLKNFTSSINSYKNLINNYPNSKYLGKTIFNLYECFVSLDTNHNQGWRNILFGDLKNYLEAKIQQYDTNENFVNLAFEFFLKSSIKKKNYQLAMDGYDFIANNSPSPTERLMASINYIDVEGLLQGSGGGQSENYENELSSDRNGKPIKDILIASYNKTKKSIDKREKADLNNSTDKVKTRTELDKKHSSDRKLENRAKENINISSSLTKVERRERIQKDLMLLHNREGYTSKKTNSEISAPIKYELSQNYPNPFNPVTNIKYQIQKTGLVTLKIYDLLGREIKTLVNEVKNPGSYVVSFNGSEFASGVYFYRIKSGDFVQVKKMLMIK